MSAQHSWILHVVSTVRGTRWWHAAAAWWAKYGGDVLSAARRLFALVLRWAILMVLAIAVTPYVAWFTVNLITNVASGEWTSAEAFTELTQMSILLAICVGAGLTVRWVRLAAPQHPRVAADAAGHPAARPVATPALPVAYLPYRPQYPSEFLEAMAAYLGPDPDVTALPSALETLWPQWRWVRSGPCPREAAIHEAVHAVVARALGGLVSKVEMFARGNAGATTYTLLLGAGQADTSMFRLCVSLAAHLWLTQDPGWDGPGPHGIDVPAPWAGRHSDGMCGCSDDLAKAAWIAAGMHATGLTPMVWPGEAVPVDGAGRTDLLAWAAQRVNAILQRNAAVVDEVAGLLLPALDEGRTVRGVDLHDVLARVPLAVPSEGADPGAGHTEVSARAAA